MSETNKMSDVDRIDLLTSALNKSKELLEISDNITKQHENLNSTNNKIIASSPWLT